MSQLATVQGLFPEQFQRFSTMLEPNESVLSILPGTYSGGGGLIAATDRRVICVVYERAFAGIGGIGMRVMKEYSVAYAHVTGIEVSEYNSIGIRLTVRGAGVTFAIATLTVSPTHSDFISIAQQEGAAGKEFAELVRRKAAPVLETMPIPRPPRWYLYLSDSVSGPFSIEQIRALVQTQTASHTTLCCQEGTEIWKQIGDSIDRA